MSPAYTIASRDHKGRALTSVRTNYDLTTLEGVLDLRTHIAAHIQPGAVFLLSTKPRTERAA